MDETRFGQNTGRKKLRLFFNFFFLICDLFKMLDQRGVKKLERKGRDLGLGKESMNCRIQSWTFPHIKGLLEAPVPVGAFNCYVKASNMN